MAKKKREKSLTIDKDSEATYWTPEGERKIREERKKEEQKKKAGGR